MDVKSQVNEKKNSLFKFLPFFNCNYPVVSQHVNHLFLSFHQVSRERNASPHGEKRKKKFHIDALWVEMIRNRRVEYSVICSSARSFARITHSFACYALVALLAGSAALIRSLRWAHSLAPLRSFARFAALIRSLVLLLHPWRFHSNIHSGC